MFYLPIIPRLQRMFASMKTTQQMTWHFDRKHESFTCCLMLSNAWLGMFQLDLQAKSLTHTDSFDFVTPSNTG